MKRHKASGQAYARAAGKCRYFGPWGSPQAEERYRRFVAELLALPVAGGEPPGCAPSGMATVAEALDGYEAHAAQRYRRPDGSETGRMGWVRQSMGVARGLYGSMRLREFGVPHLLAVRAEMARKDWNRNTISHSMACVVKAWAWLALMGYAPAGLLERMRELESLRPGELGVREPRQVVDAPEAGIVAALARLDASNPMVAAMVRTHRATGMRPGELVGMTPGEIDRATDPWVYVPVAHKCAHKGKDRVVLLLGEAMDALLPWIDRPGLAPTDPVWSPRVAVASMPKRTARKAGWRSRLMKGEERARPAGERYTPMAYAQAIRRACESAGVDVWSPYQLRHSAANRFDREFGEKAAQLLLGHSSPKTTRENYIRRSVQDILDAIGQGKAR